MNVNLASFCMKSKIWDKSPGWIKTRRGSPVGLQPTAYTNTLRWVTMQILLCVQENSVRTGKYVGPGKSRHASRQLMCIQTVRILLYHTFCRSVSGKGSLSAK